MLIIKPKFLKFLGIFYYSAQVIYPFIIIPREVITQNKTDIIEHEKFHLMRIKKAGVIKFYFKYIFDRKFRYMEELLATKAQINYLESIGIEVDYEKFAKFLSSWIYFGMVSYEKAIYDLKGSEK